MSAHPTHWRGCGFWLLCALALLGACDRTSSNLEGLAWVEQVDTLCAQAATARREGDLELAATRLEEALRLDAPSVAPGARVFVHQDLLYQLADIRFATDDPRGALDLADRGLAMGETDDVVVANLHTMRGRALEAMGRGAEAATEYERAMGIDERLLDRRLSEDSNAN